MTGFVVWTIVGLVIVGVGIVAARISNRDSLSTVLAVAGLVILGLAVLLGAIRWAILATETKACNAFGEMGREVKLVDSGPMSWTCFVKVDGEWFAKENVWSDRP